MARELARYARGDAADRGRIEREWFFRLAGRFTPALASELSTGRVLVSTSDLVIGRTTFVCGLFDEQATVDVIADVERLLPGFSLRDKTVVDVGANIGTASLIFVRTFGAARVLAFEPAPEVFAMLQYNVTGNGLRDVIYPLPVAISDEAGVVNFELSDSNAGDNRVLAVDRGEEAFAESARDVVPVASMTLDGALAANLPDLDDVALLWIDTQGHEAQVLAGASTVVGSDVPVVAEYWPYALRRAGGLDLFEALVKRNYAWVYDTGSEEPANARLLRAAEVGRLRDRYTQPAEHTDLILLK